MLLSKTYPHSSGKVKKCWWWHWWGKSYLQKIGLNFIVAKRGEL